MRNELKSLFAIQNKRWFAAAWLTVTVIFFAILLTGLNLRNSAQARASVAADEVILAIQADDAGKAYDMGSPGFRDSVTEDNLRLVFDQIGPYVRQSKIELADIHVPADTGEGSRIGLVYTATKPKSTTYVRIVLEHHGDKWQLFSLHTSGKPMSAKPNR